MKRNFGAVVLVALAVLLASVVEQRVAQAQVEQAQAVNQAATLAAAVNNFAVLTTATQLATALGGGRKNITIQNRGPNSIFCGFSAAVTTGTGFEVPPSGGVWSLDLGTAIPIWCIAATAAQVSPADTRFLEAR